MDITTKSAKTKLIADLVRQSWDGLNTFGKDPQSLTTTIKLFVNVLSTFDAKTISKAFLDWARDNEDFPAPAGISKLCQQAKQKAEPPQRGPLDPPRWFQVVLDYQTDEFLDQFSHGNHMSPAALFAKYGSRQVYTRMGREK